MIRLVAFDLDGTVLNEAGVLSSAAVETIRLLVGRGIRVASVSGRNVEKSQAPFAKAPDLAAALYIGSYNGAMALGAGGDGARPVLFEERLPAAVFRDLTEYLGKGNHNFIYCRCDVDGGGVREEYITDRDTASIRNLAGQTGMTFIYDTGLLDRRWGGELGPPPKVLIFPGKARRDAVLAEMQSIFDGCLYLARTGEDRIEAMHPDVNKAVALQAIARACDISLGEIVAIGDGDNDLPMLRAAGVGVLMGNADAQTRQTAADTGIQMAPSFSEDGFSIAIRQTLERWNVGTLERANVQTKER